MLFIPLEKEIDWKRPPAITILLIVVNVFVFFAFQSNDNENYIKSIQFYVDSGLADIELPYYERYLKNKTEASKKEDAPDIQPDEDIQVDSNKKKEEVYSEEKKYILLGELLQDGEFLRKLEADEIITKNDKNHDKWHELSEKLKSCLAIRSVMNMVYTPTNQP